MLSVSPSRNLKKAKYIKDVTQISTSSDMQQWITNICKKLKHRKYIQEVVCWKAEIMIWEFGDWVKRQKKLAIFFLSICMIKLRQELLLKILY